MIEDSRLIKLYNGFLDEELLTTRVLNEYGFNSKQIDELIERGIIERVKRGFYKMSFANGFYMLGISYINEKNYEKARICFEKCLEINKNHTGASFHLFIDSVQKQDYEKAFILLDVLIQANNPLYKNDYNYYLYLLSIISMPGEKQKEYAKHLTISDYMVNVTNTRCPNISAYNSIREAALNKRFNYAYQRLIALTTELGQFTQTDKIEKMLLKGAYNQEKNNINRLNEMLKNMQFEEALAFLLEKEDRERLNKLERYILKGIKKYLEIKETKKIPKIIGVTPNNIFDAIDNNHFSVALDLACKHNESIHLKNENSGIYLILNNICILINKLLKENSVKLERAVKPSEGKSISKMLSEVCLHLWQNEYDEAYKSLKYYLIALGKPEYEPLIINLIKINILENDMTFTKSTVLLMMINRGECDFNVSEYVQYFYESLSENKFDIARLYLDFISNLCKLQNSDLQVDKLYQILELTEKSMQQTKDDISQVNEKESALEEDTIPIKQSKTNSVQFDNNDKILIQNKYEELLKHKSLILLKPMKQERIDSIIAVSKEFQDMTAFVINDNGEKRVVLKYRPLKREYIDFKTIDKLAKEAYKNGDYEECLKYNLQLLQSLSKAKAYFYGRLGLLYLKISNLPLAIDFLTIANIKSKAEGESLDFTELIAKLKKLCIETDAEVKPDFKMSLDEFVDDDILGLFDIKNFDEIDTILRESEYDVESVCTMIGLTEEQIDAVKLYYAKAYYIQGDFEQGDLFIRSVEYKKNKTFKVWDLLEYLKKNKKFYQHRQSEPTKQIKLSLRPDKK